MYLVDTNVVSELPRPKPNPGALEWLGGQPGIVISVLTVEELTYGVERARGREQRRLRASFQYSCPSFRGLPFRLG